MVRVLILARTLSSDDGDGNEVGKKPTGLSWQNNNFARASRFFLYISFPSIHDYDVKLPDFTFYGGGGHKTKTFFSFTELRYSALEFHSRKTPQHLTN